MIVFNEVTIHPSVFVKNCPLEVAFNKLVKGEDGIYYYADKPFTGKSLLLWPTNNKKFQMVDWVDGKIDGTYQSWYEDGKRDQIIEYKGGKRHGYSNPPCGEGRGYRL